MHTTVVPNVESDPEFDGGHTGSSPEPRPRDNSEVMPLTPVPLTAPTQPPTATKTPKSRKIGRLPRGQRR
jgi:hypothetical protein